ncbi:MAG: Ig-like domain-containing protein [Gemmatimonadota bacterium]
MSPFPRMMLVSAIVLLGSCIGRDDSVLPAPGPAPAPPPAKVDPNEIEAQYVNYLGGAAGYSSTGRPRVRVTRDGAPVHGVSVFWGVNEGHITPASSVTDLNGFAEVQDWRLGLTPGEQTAWGALGAEDGAKRAYFTARVSPRP